jgi:hypothetical protein
MARLMLEMARMLYGDLQIDACECTAVIHHLHPS